MDAAARDIVRRQGAAAARAAIARFIAGPAFARVLAGDAAPGVDYPLAVDAEGNLLLLIPRIVRKQQASRGKQQFGAPDYLAVQTILGGGELLAEDAKGEKSILAGAHADRHYIMVASNNAGEKRLVSLFPLSSNRKARERDIARIKRRYAAEK